MDLSDPTRSLTPTLDGPVLAVLAAAGRPLTVGQIAAQSARGSEIGIRRSVNRLVEQGLVSAVRMGRNQVHELNRDHIAAPAAVTMSGMRLELWRRLRQTLVGWDPKPQLAYAFGSAARGDGGSDSDIDVLLVHDPLPGEATTANQRTSMAVLIESFSAVAALASGKMMSPDQVEAWHAQIDELHTSVLRWTGNPLQVLDISAWQWASRKTTDAALFAEIERDAVPLLDASLLGTRQGIAANG